MANDPHEKYEEGASTLGSEPVSVLPAWVSADWPTEDEVGVADDQPVASTRHRAQSKAEAELVRRREELARLKADG